MAEADEGGDHRRRCRAALSTPTSGSPRACGDRWTTAAPSARIAARCRSISSLSAGSSSPLPAKTTAAARIERSRRTYESLALGVPLRAAGDDQVARGRGAVLDAADHLGEVRVGDVVDDDPDHRDAALEQPAGEGVGHVVERPGGLEHALPRRRADRVVRRRDDPRGRGRRDAGQPGDLGDGCHVDGSVRERERRRLVAHRHPLPLGELVAVGRPAEPAAVARGAHPAERDDRLVVHASGR